MSDEETPFVKDTWIPLYGPKIVSLEEIIQLAKSGENHALLADAEIKRLRAELADAREVLAEMDKIIANLRAGK